MVAMSTMKGALKPSKFFFSLEKKIFTSFLEMLFHTEKYANAEEALSAKKTLVLDPSDKEKGKEREKRKEKGKILQITITRLKLEAL